MKNDRGILEFVVLTVIVIICFLSAKLQSKNILEFLMMTIPISIIYIYLCFKIGKGNR